MLKESRKINSITILNSTVNMVDIEYITKFLSSSIHEYHDNPASSVKQLVVTGFHGLHYASHDDEYFKMGEECDLWVPDSIAPVLIAKWRKVKQSGTTPGMDIMESFFEEAEKHGWSSYFYGDTQNTLDNLKMQLESRYPKLKIVGMFSPPFRPLSEAEQAEHVAMINSAKPDILWVGLGLPKQDLWIYRNKSKLQIPVASGVGAAFGFLAKTNKRAPKIWQKCGLEWLYMLLSCPKRTGKRVFVEGGDFIKKVIKEEFTRKNRSKL